MQNSKLILIEGFTGAGKSTTAKYLAEQLNKNLFLGQSAEQIMVHHQKIVDALADVQPLLIHLAQPDIEAAIGCTYSERPPEWAEANIAFCEQMPYFRQNKLMGMSGMFHFYHCWHAIEKALFNRYPYPKLALLNPHDDWQQAYQMLHTTLGLRKIK